MLCFSIALSSVVTDLAVTPLERMLGTAPYLSARLMKDRLFACFFCFTYQDGARDSRDSVPI